MSVTSKELKGLYRTFYPKYSHYEPDGIGRDSYIIKNNGGLCTEICKNATSSTLFVKDKPRLTLPAPRKDAVSFKYISDGNGRDFYITHNSGGLQAPYIPGTTRPEAAFVSSLRDNKRRNIHMRYASPKELHRMRIQAVSQQKLTKRLTSTHQEWREIARVRG